MVLKKTHSRPFYIDYINSTLKADTQSLMKTDYINSNHDWLDLVTTVRCGQFKDIVCSPFDYKGKLMDGLLINGWIILIDGFLINGLHTLEIQVSTPT